MKTNEKINALKNLRRKMINDKTLPKFEGSTNLVFGEGNPDAKFMFIGEAPGYWEDQKARPFVGRAGAFLDKMLEKIKIERADVFITNLVFYRPPNNRDPMESEIEPFQKYMDKIIKIVDPEVIITLGRFSMRKFLGDVTIGNVHGQPKKIEWSKKARIIFPMYHPAAALRNGKIQELAEADFKKLTNYKN